MWRSNAHHGRDAMTRRREVVHEGNRFVVADSVMADSGRAGADDIGRVKKLLNAAPKIKNLRQGIAGGFGG
jgi:hypothetical protein